MPINTVNDSGFFKKTYSYEKVFIIRDTIWIYILTATIKARVYVICVSAKNMNQSTTPPL